jgi:hypothetical protein
VVAATASSANVATLAAALDTVEKGNAIFTGTISFRNPDGSVTIVNITHDGNGYHSVVFNG